MKRHIFALLGIFLLFLSISCGAPEAPEAADGTNQESNGASEPVARLEFIFEDEQYSFQALRAIAASSCGAADIGECLSTTYRIEEGDDESWYGEWLRTAQRLEQAAQDFEAQGHELSAKECYFRASNYYRSAEFFLHTDPQDPRIVETWKKSRDCFVAGAMLSDTPITPVEIPFEDTTLPGYLCLVDESGAERPLLIIHTGFDGTAEELYFTTASAALKRGFNCLLFEGPGQGRVIREQHMTFRPNWETVVTPVVDFAIEQPEVDPDRIVLVGISFGGYLAPRAAAFEPRIKICIANGGIYDFHASSLRNAPPDFDKVLDDESQAEDFDEYIYEEMKTDPSLRWSFSNGMFTFGATSPSEWLRMTRPYNLRDCADKITCHMLVVDSENDKALPGQAKQLYDALQCPKDFMLFTAEEGAGEHCQVGAYMISNERIFNWLEETLQKLEE
jgi:alpha-beta hydrolase superfamily lysophospholipase